MPNGFFYFEGFFYNSQSLRMYPNRWVRHFFGQILMLVNCLSNYCYILVINDDEILIKDSQFCKMLKYIHMISLIKNCATF